jgi:hypothetical protein
VAFGNLDFIKKEPGGSCGGPALISFDNHIDILYKNGYTDHLHSHAGVANMIDSTVPVLADVWFTREGRSIPADKVHSIDLAKGKGFHAYRPICGRCGGVGSSPAWAHTGHVCYDCGGSRYAAMRTVEVFTSGRLTELNQSRDKRRAKALAKAQKAESDRLDAIRGPWMAWVNDHADVIAQMRKLASNSEFITDLLQKLDAVNMLSERQVAAAQKFIDSAKNREILRSEKMKSEYVGALGDRIEITFTVEKIIDWTKYDDYPVILRYLHICKDSEGNCL